MKEHKNEAVVFAFLTVLTAVLAIPAGIYAASFAWLAYGLLGALLGGAALAVCAMPFWCAYAAHQRWHGEEVAG